MQAESIIPPKSPNDKRTYQAIILSNKVKVLFIHDEQIVKSACSISVGVGSMYDTQRSLGLAHFLEHMLFMGSKKYPSHNQYSSFMSTNSGFDNAYTSDVETNYYFQIKNSSFNQAVSRLINFFNGALLKQDCIQKQSQAVHQQYILWTNDDNCRKWQVLRKLANPPYSRFTIGNKQTLRHENIRKDLIQFYQKYYSSNIINAVFCSNYSINQMKNNFIPLLQSIQNKQIKLPILQQPHFTKQQIGKLIQMQSIKDQTIMQYFWIVQYLKPQYKKHINDYITHIIGHQGKNSLLSILKIKKYASELSAYTHDLKNQTLIGTQIKLTQDGQQNYQEVYNIVMDYISTLKYQQYIFQQIKQRKLIQFQFKQKSKISDYVCKLSSKMHDIPLNQILNNSVIFDQNDSNAINRVLGQLNPFNVIIVLSSNQQLQEPITQKYLGAKYIIQELPQRQKSGIIFQQLPPNIFIPINTQLCPTLLDPQKIPIKINQNTYFLQDSSFRVCKGGIQLRIYNQQNYQFNQFYCNYLNLLLKQFTYPAQTLQCKVQYDVDDCIIITIFGFNDTVMKLIQGIAQQINTIHDTKNSKILFDVALQDLIETYQNFYNQQSDQVADDTIQTILTDGLNTIQKTLLQLQAYTYENITERAKKIWKHNKLKWVIVGNFQQKVIEKLIQRVQIKLHGIVSQLKIPETGCLKLTSDIVHEVHLQSQELSSSCTIVYYQAGPYSQQLFYKLLLLKNHIDQPYFNQLRTQKQMAYYLAARIQNIRGILGLRFILVSSTRDPKDISIQIKTFVNNFFNKLHEDLTGINQCTFNKLKQSVFTKLKSPHNNLKSLFQFITQQISTKTYYFNRKQQQQIHRYLNNINVNDLITTWESMRNYTLDLYVVSKAHLEAYKKHQIVNQTVQEIKDKHKFWKDLLYVDYNNQS